MDLHESPSTLSLFNILPYASQMLLDGDEINTVDATLSINNRSSLGVSIAAGGGDVWLAAGGGNVTIAGGGDGNVTIGSGHFAPGYKVSVRGKILCEELRIQNFFDWPDYVFAPDYALMDLNTLEKSIASNGHLPGIPSAGEVFEHGFHIGDMQAKLLEKIEEMTLHMIDMNKRIVKLEEENVVLKKAITTK
jgi:hypothetical protein